MKSLDGRAGRSTSPLLVLVAALVLAACQVPVTGTLTSTSSTDGATSSTTTSVTNTTIDGTGKAGVVTVVGSVHGVVLDTGGNPVAGVPYAFASENVTVATSKELKQLVTNASGMFELEGLCSGDHTIVFGGTVVAGTAYAKTVRTVHVPTLDELKTMMAPTDVVTLDTAGNPIMSLTLDAAPGAKFLELSGTVPNTVTLYPLVANVSTSGYYAGDDQYEGDAVVLPTGTRVVFDFTAMGILPATYETTVGAAGAITRTGLPSGQLAYSMYAFVDNHGVASKTIEGGLLSGTNTTATVPAKVVFRINSAPWIYSVVPDISTDALSMWTAKCFDPGTNAAPTPFVITFSKAMDATAGTITLTSTPDAGTTTFGYAVTTAWTVGNTVLTVTPTTRVKDSSEVSLVLTGFLSGQGVALDAAASTTLKSFTNPVFDIEATNLGTIVYVEGSSVDGLTDFPVGSAISLKFTQDLAPVDPNLNYLFDTGTGALVDGTLAVSADTLTFTPTSALKYNRTYSMAVSVKAKNNLAMLWENSTAFTTGPNTNAIAVTPTLNIDTNYHELSTGVTTYEFQDAAVYVSFTNLATTAGELGNTELAYYFQTKPTTSTAWSQPNAITIWGTDLTSPLLYASLAMPALSPVDGTDLRIYAARTDGPVISGYSTKQTITDTKAPAAPTYGIVGASPVFINGNPTGGANIYVVVGFNLPQISSATEPIKMPDATQVAIMNGAVQYSTTLAKVERVYKAANNLAFFVVIQIMPTGDLTGLTLKLTVQDAAGLDSTASVSGKFTTGTINTMTTGYAAPTS